MQHKILVNWIKKAKYSRIWAQKEIFNETPCWKRASQTLAWLKHFHTGELETKGRSMANLLHVRKTHSNSSTKPILIHKHTPFKLVELALKTRHTTETRAVRNQLHQQWLWLQQDTHGGRLYRLPHLEEMDRVAGVWNAGEAEQTHIYTNHSQEKGTKSRTDLQRISLLCSLNGSSSYRTPLTHTHLRLQTLHNRSEYS